VEFWFRAASTKAAKTIDFQERRGCGGIVPSRWRSCGALPWGNKPGKALLKQQQRGRASCPTGSRYTRPIRTRIITMINDAEPLLFILLHQPQSPAVTTPRRRREQCWAAMQPQKPRQRIPRTATVATVATTSLRFSLSRSICSVVQHDSREDAPEENRSRRVDGTP
jgi:hypothetical protein